MKKDKWKEEKRSMLALFIGVVSSFGLIIPATGEYIDEIKKKNKRK